MTKITNIQSELDQTREILVCVTGDTWEVVATRDGFAESDEPIWCQNKAEALKKARALFNATPSARALLAESKRDFCFYTIREREAAA